MIPSSAQSKGLAVAIAVIGIANIAMAATGTHIVPDTAPGLTMGTTVSKSGKNYLIHGGTLDGSNLFQSFSQFDLGSGGVATWEYTLGNPADVTNVISRVTGGSPSHIDGTIASDLPNADFWFINPAGIMFGTNAQVNVPNAVYFSTASNLLFADGAKFSASTPSGSALTSAVPTAFGFLGGEGNIALDGLNDTQSSQLAFSGANVDVPGSVKVTQPIDLFAVGDAAYQLNADNPLSGAPFGGKVSVSGKIVATSAILPANVSIGAGTLDLNSLGSVKTEDSISAKGGNITIEANAVDELGKIVTVSNNATGAGDIDISTDSLHMRRFSEISTVAKSTGNSGNISIAADTADITGIVKTSAKSGGDSGDIEISSKSLTLNGSVFSSTNGTANAGNINIDSDSLWMDADGSIISFAFKQGNAGNINIDTESATISGEVVSDVDLFTVREHSRNSSGNITIAAGTLDVTPTGSIDTSTFTRGRGGDIAISGGSLVVNGRISASTYANGGHGGDVSIDEMTIKVGGGSILSQTQSGPGGDISIRSGAIDLLDGGSISSSAMEGNAGNITINSSALKLASGSSITAETYGCCEGGTVKIDSHSVRVTGDSVISTTTFGSGNAGSIDVNSHSLTVSDGGTIESDTTFVPDHPQYPASGNAGNVDINATSVFVESSGSIQSSTLDSSGTGGNIAIDARNVDVNGGTIGATTGCTGTTNCGINTSGNAGDININAESLDITNKGIVDTSARESSGKPGNIVVNANSIVVDGSPSLILSGNFNPTGGSGVGGDITLKGNYIQLSNDGAVSTDTTNGPAGDISLIMPDNGILLLYGNNEPGTIRTTSGTNTGGHITISDPNVIVMNGADIQALGPGNEADITLNAGVIIKSTDRMNDIDVAGNLALDSEVLDVGKTVTAPDLSFLDASNVLTGQCAAQRSGVPASRLSTVAPGPYAVPANQPARSASASLGASYSGCGVVGAGDGSNPASRPREANSYPSVSRMSDADSPSPLAPPIDSPTFPKKSHAGFDRTFAPSEEAPAIVPVADLEPVRSDAAPDSGPDDPVASPAVLLVANATAPLSPRTGPNSQASSAPPFAPPPANPIIIPAPPPPPQSSANEGGELLHDIKIVSNVDHFAARPAKRWRPDQAASGGLSLTLRPGEMLDVAWIKEQFQNNGMIGKDVSIDQLVELTLLINRALVQNGYVNSGLLLRSTWPSPDGIARFELVAGGIGFGETSQHEPEINWGANGSQGLDVDYVNGRLPSIQAVPFNAFDLEYDFRLLADDPAIQTVNASLQPGSHPGEASLSLRVDPAPQYDLYTSASDSRSPSVGGYRAAVGGSIRNMSQSGDLLSGEFGLTEGLVDATLDYAMPLITPRLTVDLRLSGDEATVVDQALQALGIRSKEASVDEGLSYKVLDIPLMPTGEAGNWSPAEQLTLGGLIAASEARTTLLGMPFSFSPGADDGLTNFTVVRATADWTQRNVDQVWRVSATASLGLKGTGSDIGGPSEPQRNFKAVLVQADFSQRLTDDDIEFKFKSAGQWSSGPLYSEERFAVGGAYTVSGYRENLLLADMGAFASVEFSCPVGLTDIPCSPRAHERDSFRVALFADGAVVHDAVAPQPTPSHVASVGLSLTWTPTNYFFAQVSYAKALVPAEIIGPRDLQDDGVNFQVTLHPIEMLDVEL